MRTRCVLAIGLLLVLAAAGCRRSDATCGSTFTCIPVDTTQTPRSLNAYFAAFDHAGNLLVADPQYILKYDPAGRLIGSMSIKTSVGGGPGIAVDANDSLWISDYARPNLYHARFGDKHLVPFEPESLAKFRARPFDLKLDGAGRLYMTSYRDPAVDNDTAGVFRFDPRTREWKVLWLTPDTVRELALDPIHHRILVSDQTNSCVIVLDEQGKCVGRSATQAIGPPEGIAVGPSGRIYVTFTNADSVQTESLTVSNSIVVGHSPPDSCLFPHAHKNLLQPVGVYVHGRDRLYVVEDSLRRVVAWKRACGF